MAILCALSLRAQVADPDDSGPPPDVVRLTKLILNLRQTKGRGGGRRHF
jgi:hypothetical protein